METTYIPYSKRNGITDPDLGGLLDYIERVIGWEITEFSIADFQNETITRFQVGKYSVFMVDDKVFNFDNIFKTSPQIFFRTYKTLLPVIRDIYS